MNSHNAPQGVRTLLEFTTAIGNAIRCSPDLYSAWIVAELSDVRISGGHCYMELVEKNEVGATVAKLRAMIWSSSLPSLRKKFYDSTGRDITSGLKVMVKGSANHHPVYGLSMTINDIDPSYTLGDLERLRREILMQLQKEGVLDANRRLRLPQAPQRIAVISAAGAAGYGDFINQLESNSGGYVFYTHLFPAVMQGDKTVPSVLAALEAVEMTIDLWDCVVIIRGGGATSEMNSFDDYVLARSVATFPLPVIVGIGHERDRCVLDEIAHTRCKTPTAVASFLIDTLAEAWMKADRLTRAIAQYASERIQGETRRLAQTGAYIPSVAQNIIERTSLKLDHYKSQIRTNADIILQRADMRLDNFKTAIGSASDTIIERASLRLGHYRESLVVASSTALQREKVRLQNLSGLCEALSPANTLRRGYSVTRVNGKATKDVASLPPGTIIETQLYDGKVISEVKKIGQG